MDKYVKKILEANVYDIAKETSLDFAPALSARLDNDIFLKREDQQPVFSFKLRGAYNKMRLLNEKDKRKGVITASAGNHAQGVAMAAAKLNIEATIVMGENTPRIKVNAVSSLGGKVILVGGSYDEAALHAKQLASKKGLTYIHPFDDVDVIAGQGTVGMEMLRQSSGSPNAIFVPVGGGGLISGIAAYVKFLRPDIKIIGVESEGAASMYQALKKGRRVLIKADQLDQFADGTAVRQVGKHTFAVARRTVDEIITVSIDEICAAIKDIFEDTRVITEPSGALSIAGVKKYVARGARDETLYAVLSGANVNFDRLRHISERTEIGEQQEALFGVTIDEQAGSFRKFCQTIGKRSITEFNYRYNVAGKAHVLVGIQTSGDNDDKQKLIARLTKKYQLTDLSNNEVAVLHVRHMVGGRAMEVADEKLFRFEFPEKPGALLDFLTVLGEDFNISMFHYRNHGSAYGRVLAGIQVPDGEMKKFRKGLKKIGYHFWDESENPAYKMFLGH